MPTAVYILDEDGMIVWACKNACRHLLYSQTEIRTMHFARVCVTDPVVVFELLAETAATGWKIISELWHKRSDGEPARCEMIEFRRGPGGYMRVELTYPDGSDCGRELTNVPVRTDVLIMSDPNGTAHQDGSAKRMGTDAITCTDALSLWLATLESRGVKDRRRKVERMRRVCSGVEIERVADLTTNACEEYLVAKRTSDRFGKPIGARRTT